MPGSRGLTPATQELGQESIYQRSMSASPQRLNDRQRAVQVTISFCDLRPGNGMEGVSGQSGQALVVE